MEEQEDEIKKLNEVTFFFWFVFNDKLLSKVKEVIKTRI